MFGSVTSIGYFLQVILLRVLARYLSGRNKFSNVRRFSILQSGGGSTSFNNDNSDNLSGEEKYNEEYYSRVSIS